MRLSAVQFKPEKGAFEPTFSRLVSLVESAAAGSDLVVCPEMAVSGYLFADRSSVAEVAETAKGESFGRLSPIARRERCWIVFGFPEVDGDRFFNSALVINPAGELAFCYRKTLLYEADLSWATPGDSGYRFFDAEWGRFGVGICMDLNDDAFTSWCQGSQLDALAFPTNWIEEGADVWNYWAWRIRGANFALVAANSYGPEGTTRFCGRSAIIKQNGLYASAPESGDCVIRAVF